MTEQGQVVLVTPGSLALHRGIFLSTFYGSENILRALPGCDPFLIPS
jgi:hypothetical protein